MLSSPPRLNRQVLVLQAGLWRVSFQACVLSLLFALGAVWANDAKPPVGTSPKKPTETATEQVTVSLLELPIDAASGQKTVSLLDMPLPYGQTAEAVQTGQAALLSPDGPQAPEPSASGTAESASAGTLAAPQKSPSVSAEPPVLSSLSESVLRQAMAEDVVELSYDTFITSVEANHPKITAADLKRRIAGAKYLEKQGAFDPGIRLESEYLRYNDFTSRGKESETFDNEATLSLLTRSGIQLSTGARYNTGDVKPPLYPTGDSGEYFVGIKVPLLRGFRINQSVLAERQAKLGIPEADLNFANARLVLLQDASVAYWDWVASHQKREIAQRLLLIAQERYKAVRGRVILGDMPSIDEVETLQEVTRREGQFAKAERDAQKALLKLGLYWWQNNGLPAEASIKPPSQLPEPNAVDDEDWMTARESAIEKRPELATLDIQRDMTEVDLEYAKNLRLPILDLFAQPGLDTGGQSIGPTMKAGVLLTIPLRQRTARGKVLAARYSLQQIDVTQRMVLQQVLNEVDDSVSALRAISRQHDAAQKELTLSRLLEDGERQKFELGDSTIFMLNQRERARAESEMKVVDVTAAFQQAKAVYQAVSARF